MLSFLRSFTIYILIVVIILAYPMYSLLGILLLGAFGQSMLLFVCLTIGAMALITYKGKEQKEMVNKYLMSIGLKMLVALVYFVVMLKTFKGHELGFALCFFSAYLICTCFEIYYLISNLRQNSEGTHNAIK